MGCKKVRFSDEVSAERYIIILNRTEKKRRVTPVRAYLCPDCLSWHLTSGKDREEEEIRKLKWRVEELSKKVNNQNRVINELNHKIREVKDKNNELRKELGIWNDIGNL